MSMTSKNLKRANQIAADGQRELSAYEYLHGETPIGDQLRFHHVACGDSRQRLYVKRVINESGIAGILAFCHNCGSGGAAYSPGIGRYVAGRTPLTATAPLPLKNPVLPGDLEPANKICLDYMNQYGFGNPSYFGVGWSGQYQRIVLPVQDGPLGPVHGCQLRRVGAAGPKYITLRSDTKAPLECFWGTQGDHTVVITEDLLSAWRCWDAGFNAIPLLGNHIRPERLAQKIHDGYQNWCVWLDNDRPEIEDAARHIQRMIRALGGKAGLVPNRTEPKECSIEQVQNTVGAQHDR